MVLLVVRPCSPCLPDSNRGDHQVDLLLDMLCQNARAIVQSTGFALFPRRQACDGCKAFQLSQADRVDADGEDPALGADIIGSRSRINCDNKSFVKGKVLSLEILPQTMTTKCGTASLVLVELLVDPPSGP